MKICEWYEDSGDDGLWISGCDLEWHFQEGGPLQNGMKYCPFCSGPLKVDTRKGGDHATSSE